MQQGTSRRPNRERSEATRGALVAAARALFLDKSYAATGTPEIAAAAQVTRGALYHHFADKRALFHAVVDAESAAVAADIEHASPEGLAPVEALLRGGEAFFSAMAVAGRTRLLLLDGPAVLGRAAMDDIDARHAGRTLHEGVVAAIEAGAWPPLSADALTALLSAAFDRAALAIEAGADPQHYRDALAGLITGLSRQSRRSGDALDRPA